METLLSLFESKTKMLIVCFLVLASERTFTAKELAGRLGLSATLVTKELKNLVGKGIVKEFSRRSHTFYLLSSKNKLIADIRPSLLKSQGKHEDELFAAIRRLGNIRAAFLSGLFTGNPELPVDILLVGKINLNRLQRFLEACHKLMGVEINYSIMTEAEFIQRRDTFDRFIKDIFDYRHVTVVDKISPRSKKNFSLASMSKFKVSRF